MSTESAVELSEPDLRTEIERLRRDLLPTFLVGILAVAWLWFGRVVMAFDSWDLGPNVLPSAILCAGVGLAFWLRASHHDMATWVAVLGLVLAQALLVLQHPESLAGAFGVLAVLASQALLGAWQGALVLALCVFGNAWARAQAPTMGPSSAGDPVQEGALLVLTWACAWLATRPLQSAVGWALTGWDKARRALAETRERRAEIYRILRALEEATYRVERMNNELVVARREAEIARALKSRFSATLSHELRAPLNLILGFSSMMVLSPERYGEPLPSAYLADIDTIYRNSLHLSALVDDVLDLSQIEAEKLPLLKERVDLESEVIVPVVQSVLPLAQRKGLYLRHEGQSHLPAVVDPARLRQVLLNLVNNALRFTERGGITLHTAVQQGSLVISVRDTGTGIAADDIPRLFQEFNQLQLTDVRTQAGTGLGLSISKHLVELHGGRIWAESAKGIGSTFHVSLPLAADELPELTVPTPARPHVPGDTNTCLVVHESADFVRRLGRYLRDYSVLGLASASDLLSTVEHLHPRAILTDSGRCAAVQEALQSGGQNVPVLACQLPAAGGSWAERGVLAYLVKPLSEDVLRAVLAGAGALSEPSVLLVDDEPDAVRLLERMLVGVARPSRIVRAYTAAQALEALQRMEPDLAFIDLMLPDGSGEQIIEQMRANPRLAKVQVVIVSGQDAAGQQQALGTPLCVYSRRALDMDEASQCLHALLDAFRPSYLPEPVAP